MGYLNSKNMTALRCRKCQKYLNELEEHFSFPSKLCAGCHYMEITDKRPDEPENRERYYQSFSNF